MSTVILGIEYMNQNEPLHPAMKPIEKGDWTLN